MTNFLYGTHLNLALENMILAAEEYLWFISPYIKLHNRIKEELSRKKHLDTLEIVIVFGKNEDDVSKSISSEDIEFLKEFPNVLIGYEKNLHAKYYASENISLITSMNLHQFSQNTNVEVGIVLNPRNTIKQIADSVSNKSDAGEDAANYFSDIIEQSQKLFHKVPKYKSTLLGLQKVYTHSVVEIDELNLYFNRRKTNYRINNSSQDETSDQKIGYCIRTGVEIPFDPARPLCYEAYQSWSQFKNYDYPEKFCHQTGKKSKGKTNMRNPIL